MRAVTAWSMFGAYDWVSLLTQNVGHYEAGVFDVRSGQPRATLLARLVRCLASGQAFQHPVLQGLGWWQRPGRVHFEPSRAPARARTSFANAGLPAVRPAQAPAKKLRYAA